MKEDWGVTTEPPRRHTKAGCLDLPKFESISCDYFLYALADPDFALKVRERHPEDLDFALLIALQPEVWTKDVDRLRGERTQGERTQDGKRKVK